MTHEEVWQILEEECGADELAIGHGWWAFEAHWPECSEFRFIGALGFGGKIWNGGRDRPHYVTCYREDETPERRAMIERANARLARGAGPA